MNVRITRLKAPWPEGAQIGSIISFKADAPAWATGKHVLAPDDAKADFTYEPGTAEPWKPGAPASKAAKV